MESWENKIIREKMDSLQQLPAGYTPNLASKWEIIEAGLPQQKKRVVPLLARWSVAAAIIASIFFIGITINNNAPHAILASIKTPSMHIPSASQKEQTAAIAKPVVIKNKEAQKELKPAVASTIEVIAKGEKLQLVNSDLQINELIPVIDSATIVNDDLAAVVTQPELSKKVKRHTYQKDFNDGLIVMDTGYSKPASPQFSFKLQLHKPNTDDVQPSRRLQLKQVL